MKNLVNMTAMSWSAEIMLVTCQNRCTISGAGLAIDSCMNQTGNEAQKERLLEMSKNSQPTVSISTSIAVALKEIDNDMALNIRKSYDKDAIEALARDMGTVGQLTPVIVQETKGANGKFRLIAGYRRCVAAGMLGWETIQAIPFAGTDEQADLMNAKENLSREDLTTYEKASAFDRMKKKHGWSAARISKELEGFQALNRNTINRYIALLEKLPEQYLNIWANPQNLQHGLCSIGNLEALVKLPPEQQAEYWDRLAGNFEARGANAASNQGGEKTENKPDRPSVKRIKQALACLGAVAKKNNAHLAAISTLEWVLGASDDIKAGKTDIMLADTLDDFIAGVKAAADEEKEKAKEEKRLAKQKEQAAALREKAEAIEKGNKKN